MTAQCVEAVLAVVMVSAVTAVTSLLPSVTARDAFSLRDCASLSSIALARCSLTVSLAFLALEAAANPVRVFARSIFGSSASEERVTPRLASASSSGDGGTSAGESGSGAANGVIRPAEGGVARARCPAMDSACTARFSASRCAARASAT